MTSQHSKVTVGKAMAIVLIVVIGVWSVLSLGPRLSPEEKIQADFTRITEYARQYFNRHGNYSEFVFPMGERSDSEAIDLKIVPVEREDPRGLVWYGLFVKAHHRDLEGVVCYLGIGVGKDSIPIPEIFVDRNHLEQRYCTER